MKCVRQANLIELGRRVPLSDEQHTLVGEALGIDGHVDVPLRRLDARDGRDVRLGESRRRDHPFRTVAPAGRVGDEEVTRAVAVDRRARDLDDAGVAADSKRMGRCEVVQVAKVVVCIPEVARRVSGEAELWIVAQQGVPIPPQRELGVVVAGVRLVDRDHAAMPWEGLEEPAGSVAGLEDQVVPARTLEEVAELQAGRARAYDEVVDGLWNHTDLRSEPRARAAALRRGFPRQAAANGSRARRNRRDDPDLRWSVARPMPMSTPAQIGGEVRWPVDDQVRRRIHSPEFMSLA
jgi:hypothetical protein